MFYKLHNLDIFSKRNDDEDLKRLCDVLLLKPRLTFGFTECIGFSPEAQNGGGLWDFEPLDDCVACSLSTSPLGKFAYLDPIKTFNAL